MEIQYIIEQGDLRWGPFLTVIGAVTWAHKALPLKNWSVRPLQIPPEF